MNEPDNFTLVNPQNGNLAFKTYRFESFSHFDHIQRLGYYTMILLQSGIGDLKADLSEYTVHENMLMCFTPYQPFMLVAGGPVAGYCIHFHPDFFCIHKHQEETACNGVLFNNIYDPPFLYTRQEETIQLITLVHQMIAEMKEPGLDQYHLLISYLKIFLITASRIKVAQRPKALDNFSIEQKPAVAGKLREEIEKYFKVKHSASDYASLLNISPKALARICRTHFQKTLTDLIAERIIIEAKRELYLTNKSVKEIAWELGYEDEFYFSRFFKKNSSISPQFYRETIGFARAAG